MRHIKINLTVAASTLMEVIVGLVIIMTVFSITEVIMVNVSFVNGTGMKLEALLLAEDIANTTIRDKTNENELIETKKFSVDKKVYDYEQGIGLKVLELVVYNKRKKRLLSQKRLILE